MKKFYILVFAFFLSFGAMAQLEVKQGSFKEVTGFVNINLDIQEDDNNVPYAVIKVKTENINDKQRRELLFQGDAATFIECEYKVGEVWVYLTYKATYLKISHPDLSSTEFWFPFDMAPKKGYELTLVNNAKLSEEELLERMIKLEEALQNQPEPQIVYVEKPVIQQVVSQEPPKTPHTNFFLLNASMNTYSQMAYGLTMGSMKKVGVFVNLMTNFNFNDIDVSSLDKCDSEDFPSKYGQEYTAGNYRYTSYSGIFGFVVKIYGPFSVKIGGGYGNNSMVCTIDDDTRVWISDVSSYGFSGLFGVNYNWRFLSFSLDYGTTNFKIHEARLGIGFNYKR